MRPTTLLIPISVIVGVSAVVHWATSVPTMAVDTQSVSQPSSDFEMAVAEVDAYLQRVWDEELIAPAAPATELQVFRRLKLALHGTVPSLEDIRDFERDSPTDRLWHWTERLLAAVQIRRVATTVPQLHTRQGTVPVHALPQLRLGANILVVPQ